MTTDHDRRQKLIAILQLAYSGALSAIGAKCESLGQRPSYRAIELDQR